MEKTRSEVAVWLPLGVCGHNGSVSIAVVEGDAPLLLSKPFIRALGGVLDLMDNTIYFRTLKKTAKLNEDDGHFVLDLMEFCTQKEKTGPVTVKTRDLEVFYDALEETEPAEGVVFQ